MSIVGWIDRSFYPDFGKNWDDQLFRDRIIATLSPDNRILDLGAGAGIVAAMNFRGLVREVCGVDLDPRVMENPYLDQAHVATGETIPYEDGSFDLVFADNVAEHLTEPSAVFAEVARVLRPGGRFLFKTPNRAHYMPIIARATPLAFHRFINRRRGRLEEDTFPTVYRSNSVKQITALARQSDLAITDIELIEGRPEYLRISTPTYLMGLAYERIVNASPALRGLRVVLIASLRKG